MSDPRARTPEEVRDKLLEHICHTIDYWDKTTDDKRTAMEGVAFSILSALDGCSVAVPAFLVTPMSHPDDIAHYKSEGKNWYPEDQPDLGMLHEHFYEVMKQVKGES